MATVVTFSGTAEVNNTQYVKGDKLSVSDSIYDRLKAEGKIEPEKKGK